MTVRHGSLPFAQSSSQFSSADTKMDEIITNGSASAASCPGFRTQKEMLDNACDTEDVKHDDVEEEVEEEQPAAPVTKGRKKGRLSNTKLAEPRVNWMPKEDECRAEAWKTVIIHTITDAYQNVETYRKRIKSSFDERKMVDPELSSIHMDHSEKVMANHWATNQLACNK
ncbi:D-2-hydroxyglutarate dehydrogenase, mitochondrial [Hordeum vulgare]|nr:D-2-hydroxyglutarate dehydrogenase, mitochondrial [Hordeum vulgare]